MHTDIPLKVLIKERGPDLFNLLGIPQTSTLLSVETLELPAVAKRLDVMLHLVTPDGQHHKHIVEWHGWRDPAVLWRTMGYLGVYGQDHPDDPLTITLVYLAPEYDMGTTITHVIGTTVMLEYRIHCVRLWLFPAKDAIAAGVPGLAVLSPLMQGATEETVRIAVTIIRTTTSKPQQSDLLTILAGFAAPLAKNPEHLLDLFGKEPWMFESEVFQKLLAQYAEPIVQAAKQEMQHEVQAAKQEVQAAKHEMQAAKHEMQQQELATKHEMQQQVQQQMQNVINDLHNTLEQSVTARFPEAPIALSLRLRQFTTTTQINALIRTLVVAPNLRDFEQVVQQMETSTQN